jgi:hypothetical protein
MRRLCIFTIKFIRADPYHRLGEGFDLLKEGGEERGKEGGEKEEEVNY